MVQLEHFTKRLQRLAIVVDTLLLEELSREDAGSSLSRAVNYSVLAPGKRIRAVLTFLVAEALQVERSKLRSFVVALEFLHSASLIHDDLPALDNDDERRGQPTAHRVFGEGVALLSADQLISRAFYVLSSDKGLSAEIRVGLVEGLSNAFSALCAGQVLDLEAEGSRGSGPRQLPLWVAEEAASELRTRHLLKTGALFGIAASAPGYFLESETQSWPIISALERFGLQLGLLFQVVDDILDKDELKHRGQGLPPTYLSLYGESRAKEIATATAESAHEFLAPLGEKASELRQLVDYVINRSEPN